MMLFWPGLMAYKPQEMFFQYGVFVLFGLSLINERQRECLNKRLFYFLATLFILTITKHFEVVPRMTMLNMFLGFVAVKIIADYIELDYEKIATVFEWVCVLNVIWLALQVLNIDPIFTNVYYENMPQVDHVGFMGARFALGCAGALMLPFILRHKLWHAIIILPMLWFSKSSTVMGASALIFGVYLWARMPKRGFFRPLFILACLSAGVLALVYIFYFDLPTGQFEKRFVVWGMAVKIWTQNPFYGIGLGEWKNLGVMGIQQNGELENWVWVHNEFFQVLVEGGLFPFILLLVYVWNLVKTVPDWTIKSAVIALCAISMFHFPFHVGRLACLGVFILGIAEAVRREDEHEVSA